MRNDHTRESNPWGRSTGVRQPRKRGETVRKARVALRRCRSRAAMRAEGWTKGARGWVRA